MVQEMAEEAYVGFFNVLARYEGQRPIFFGRFKPEPRLAKVQRTVLSPLNSLITG